jgi:lipid A disaccharide synthetase
LPFNRLDDAVIPGIGGYLRHVPLVGLPLKRWLALSFERRFKYVAQPNIDADKLLVPELRGELTADGIARRALAMLADPDSLRSMGEELSRLYVRDVGASARMAREALAVAAEAVGPAAGAAS